jgi:hypothetical protein
MLLLLLLLPFATTGLAVRVTTLCCSGVRTSTAFLVTVEGWKPLGMCELAGRPASLVLAAW